MKQIITMMAVAATLLLMPSKMSAQDVCSEQEIFVVENTEDLIQFDLLTDEELELCIGADDDDAKARNAMIMMFIQKNKRKFRASDLMVIKSQMEGMTKEQVAFLTSVHFKNPAGITALSVFFGGLGVDRMVMGQVGLGVLKLITAGGFGWWYFIDWFVVGNKTRDINMEKFINKSMMTSQM